MWLCLIVVALIAAACSGGSGGANSEQPGGGALVDEAVDTANPHQGAVDLLVVQPSFGFGMFAVDVERGEATAVAAPAEVSAIDLGNDVILSDGAGYALGSTVRAGQTSASDISVVRVDLATGVATQLVALGPERETDADEGGTSYSLVAVVDNRVLVRSAAFASAEGTYAAYDATTGERQSSFDEPTYSFESDAGSCSGGISDLAPLTDGRLIGATLRKPAILDPDSGEIDLLGMCGQTIGSLGDFVSADQLGRYGVFTQGPAPSPAATELMLETELGPNFGLIEAWGDLWWISVSAPILDQSHALVGGLVQFDLESRRIAAVHSLGVHLGTFEECEPGALICASRSLEQAQLRVIADQLVIMDINENGRLLLFDPATSAFRPVELDRGGTDFTSATLLAGNPDEIWVEVRRMTITQDDGTSRSAFGPTYLERVDPQTGQVNRSLAADDLFFS